VDRRWMAVLLGMLTAGVLAGGFYFYTLRQEQLRSRAGRTAEEQARRAVLAPPISTPSDVATQATIFWASADEPGTLAPATVPMALSADARERARQVIDALITRAPAPERATVPADTTLLAFYLLPDGTAIADFSEQLAQETPSGILSEQLAVDSIAQTLAANVDSARRLKILIGGQEAETLAGHLDLTGFFPLTAAGSTAPAEGQGRSSDPSVLKNKDKSGVPAGGNTGPAKN
jgi:hypothetical protein